VQLALLAHDLCNHDLESLQQGSKVVIFFVIVLLVCQHVAGMCPDNTHSLLCVVAAFVQAFQGLPAPFTGVQAID
jgi:hypothetical protein